MLSAGSFIWCFGLFWFEPGMKPKRSIIHVGKTLPVAQDPDKGKWLPSEQEDQSLVLKQTNKQKPSIEGRQRQIKPYGSLASQLQQPGKS